MGGSLTSTGYRSSSGESREELGIGRFELETLGKRRAAGLPEGLEHGGVLVIRQVEVAEQSANQPRMRLELRVERSSPARSREGGEIRSGLEQSDEAGSHARTAAGIRGDGIGQRRFDADRAGTGHPAVDAWGED